ncbi:MAG: Re/Si-specific NAD(P)(+) transhydrogenase subunit alpha [Candidatus Hydrothermarchaeales archaeon]
MDIAVAREIKTGERRVALVPDAVARLADAGLVVWVEAGAGEPAFFSDSSYEEAGAEIVSDATSLFGRADVLLKVGPPQERDGKHEVNMLSEGAVSIGFLNPLGNPALVKRLAERRVTAFSMELIPRISRAQSMDALTSQAGLAGYKAALIAANTLRKFFPMLTTAAGTMAPAKVLVLGAGVAGLHAIATARRLGAVVEAFDIRPVVKEEVQSLGAKFLEVELEEETLAEGGYAREVSEAAKKHEQEMLAEHVKMSDVVITTAAVPGKRAPVLLTKEMVAPMKPGSVIVDLAAEQGGNCAFTDADKEVVHKGVTILGPTNLPSSMPVHASQMYSRNISSLFHHLLKNGELHLDFDDEIIDGACVTHEGIIRNESVRAALEEG